MKTDTQRAKQNEYNAKYRARTSKIKKFSRQLDEAVQAMEKLPPGAPGRKGWREEAELARGLLAEVEH